MGEQAEDVVVRILESLDERQETSGLKDSLTKVWQAGDWTAEEIVTVVEQRVSQDEAE